LFNWLRPVINGANCLDLFAGTGVLGLEAKSRGANHVTFVEQNSVLSDQLQQSIDMLGVHDISLQRTDSLQWIKNNDQKFDVIFLDPPFGLGLIETTCTLLLHHNCLYPKTWVYIEGEKGMPVPAGFERQKQGTAGQVDFMLLQQA